MEEEGVRQPFWIFFLPPPSSLFPSFPHFDVTPLFVSVVRVSVRACRLQGENEDGDEEDD